MKRYNKNIGDFGENVANEYLISKGYEILEKNYRTAAGEIDIIARFGQTLVFVEVKTRSSVKCGRPSEAVDFRKRKHMAEAAEIYCIENMINEEVRFDVIEIIARHLGGDEYAAQCLNHIKEIVVD